MSDKRSMLFAHPGDQVALEELSGHAFAMLFYDVVHEGFGAVDVSKLGNTLVAGEGLLVDALQRFGSTQEEVIEALQELVISYRIRVFVLDNRRGIVEIMPETVRLMQSFRILDVVLKRGAARGLPHYILRHS